MSLLLRLLMLPGRLVPAALFALATALAVPSLAQGAAENHVVMQVSDADPAKWNLALNNARNLQADLGASHVDIEIVAYGPGLAMLKLDSAAGGRIDEAHSAGVKLVACENTMRGLQLTRADMLPNLDYAPAGVTHIMKRQQQGWAYIRP